MACYAWRQQRCRQAHQENRVSRDIRLWFSLAVLGLVVIFTLQNVVTVEVTFLVWTIALPRAILLFVVFVIGLAIGWILKSVAGRRRAP
jgi:uncharacterized integral membrane protein